MKAEDHEKTTASEASSRSGKLVKLGLFALLGVVAVAVIGMGTVFAVSSSRMNETYDVEPVSLEVEPSSDLVERGAELAMYRGCRDCHGENLQGRVVGDAMPVMILAGPNITPGGVTKDYTDVDWARAIRHGVKPDGTSAFFMPSYEYTTLSHYDLAAIISYAKSVPAVHEPAPPFEVGPVGRLLYLAGELPLIAAEKVDHSAKPESPERGPTPEYGRYLSTACIGCHGDSLAGGPIPGVPPDWPPASNLTPHDDGLGSWTFDDFKNTFRTGKTPDGRKLKDEFMPVSFVSKSSTDEDLRALWEYTRSLPPKPTGAK